MAQAKNGRQAREEREKMLILKHKFEKRITVTKFGKEALDAGDYSSAIQHFVEYLQIMADIKKTKDYYSLRPSHFDPKKDLTEMMMMSHVFFEMARVYDAVPKFAEESKKCLELFVIFSANQPYQVVNSELVRKHLKKSVFKNADNFRHSYEQIYVQSKQCYIVTFCYGDAAPITQDYRNFKDVLLDYSIGREMVRIYYCWSSIHVPRWQNSISAHRVGKYLVKPILLLFSKTILRFIISKC